MEPGNLTYGEYYLPRETTDEVLISYHACHPSLANDNLAGIAIATFLAKQLSQVARRYSYRFIFIPVTIGSITWLSLSSGGKEVQMLNSDIQDWKIAFVDMGLSSNIGQRLRALSQGCDVICEVIRALHICKV